jgi:hypothetical protein
MNWFEQFKRWLDYREQRKAAARYREEVESNPLRPLEPGGITPFDLYPFSVEDLQRAQDHAERLRLQANQPEEYLTYPGYLDPEKPLQSTPTRYVPARGPAPVGQKDTPGGSGPVVSPARSSVKDLSGTGFLSALPAAAQVTLGVTNNQAIQILNGLNQLLGLWQSQKIATTKFVVTANVTELTTFRNDLANLLKEKGLK